MEYQPTRDECHFNVDQETNSQDEDFTNFTIIHHLEQAGQICHDILTFIFCH